VAAADDHGRRIAGASMTTPPAAANEGTYTGTVTHSVA
jgi:hypothetical protein